MNTKSYYDVAMNDYEYFEWLIQSKNLEKTRNPIAVQSQQIVEKLLKYILEEIAIESDNTDLLRLHKLRTLGTAIKNQLGVAVISGDDARFLTDFYYDARYPGDSYIIVSEEDVNRAIQITNDVVKVVRQLHAVGVSQLEQKENAVLKEQK